MTLGASGIPYSPTREFYTEVARGAISGFSLVHKFGHSIATTTLQPVSTSLTYQTPTTATALEILSSDANDTSAGSGAREVTIIGLDTNWAEVTQTATMNGTTAVALATNLIRVYRAYVSSSGTYGSASASSHAGTITIRTAGAGATWAQIPLVGAFGIGQTEIAAYTIPQGKTAYLLSKRVTVQNGKVVDLFFFSRPAADDIISPYSGAIRLTQREVDLGGAVSVNYASPRDAFVGACDIGYMAKTSAGTAEISAEFELLLVG